MKCEYEGSRVWAGRCLGTREVDPCPGYDKCERFKPDYKTNADWLRSLSDSELAMVIAKEFTSVHILATTLDVADVHKMILHWLQQPHENEVK